MFKRNGFSLVETVIAAFIFITTVAGILSVWTAHSRGIAKARMVLVANELSEQLMEECVAARFQNVELLSDAVTGPKPPVEIDFMIKNRPLKAVFYPNVTVVDRLTVGLEVVIKEVRVEIEWTDSTNATGDRSSVVIISELHRDA